ERFAAMGRTARFQLFLPLLTARTPAGRRSRLERPRPARGRGGRAARRLGPGPDRVVQRHDAAREVAPAHPLPPRGPDPPAELLLGRPGLDGLGEVDVGLRVAADAPGDR